MPAEIRTNAATMSQKVPLCQISPQVRPSGRGDCMRPHSFLLTCTCGDQRGKRSCRESLPGQTSHFEVVQFRFTDNKLGDGGMLTDSPRFSRRSAEGTRISV